MNAPQSIYTKRPPQQVQPTPIGNWICKCGIGHYQHETTCVSCGKPYEPIPDDNAE